MTRRLLVTKKSAAGAAGFPFGFIGNGSVAATDAWLAESGVLTGDVWRSQADFDALGWVGASTSGENPTEQAALPVGEKTYQYVGAADGVALRFPIGELNGGVTRNQSSCGNINAFNFQVDPGQDQVLQVECAIRVNQGLYNMYDGTPSGSASKLFEFWASGGPFQYHAVILSMAPHVRLVHHGSGSDVGRNRSGDGTETRQGYIPWPKGLWGGSRQYRPPAYPFKNTGDRFLNWYQNGQISGPDSDNWNSANWPNFGENPEFMTPDKWYMFRMVLDQAAHIVDLYVRDEDDPLTERLILRGWSDVGSVAGQRTRQLQLTPYRTGLNISGDLPGGLVGECLYNCFRVKNITSTVYPGGVPGTLLGHAIRSTQWDDRWWDEFAGAGWTQANNGVAGESGFFGAQKTSTGGTGNEGRWLWEGDIAAGLRGVYVGFVVDPGNNASVTYTVRDGGPLATILGTPTLDQTANPQAGSLGRDHVHWHHLGNFTFSGADATLEVSDAGTGLVRADMAYIGEPFPIGPSVASPVIIDSADAGWVNTLGTWTNTNNPSYGGGNAQQATVRETGVTHKCEFRFSGLTAAKQHHVGVSWHASDSLASGLTVRVYDGSSAAAALLDSFPLDLNYSPEGVAFDGILYELLGLVTPTGTDLTIELDNITSSPVTGMEPRLNVLADRALVWEVD